MSHGAGFSITRYRYVMYFLATDPCQCKITWTSPDDGGESENTQHGCTDCAGENSPWCIVANPGCDTEEEGEGWSYCSKQNFT